MSLRGERIDRREIRSTKQSRESKRNFNGLLRRPFGTPRNDVKERLDQRLLRRTTTRNVPIGVRTGFVILVRWFSKQHFSPFFCIMSKIAFFRFSLVISFALAMLFQSHDNASAQTSAGIHPVPPPAVTSTKSALAQGDAKTASRDEPLSMTQYNCGNPTNEEQYQLELINRARANPDSEGIRLEFDTTTQVVFDYSWFPKQGVYAPTPEQVAADFATYPARPPLAFNAVLCQAARGHDTVMLLLDSQYHYLDNSDSIRYPQDGGALGPEKRIENAGYVNWSNWGENIYDYGNGMDDILAAFLVDWENSDLGHRHNIMNFASTDAIFNEVGIAILDSSDPTGVGPILITEDFGRRMIDKFFTAPYTFVLGVVYTDSNKNGLYDIGEGDSDVTITLSSGSSYYAVTTGSGGYAIPYTYGAAHNVTVTASTPLTLLAPKNGANVTDTVAFTWNGSGPFVSPISQIVQVDTENVKVDFIAPQSSQKASNYLLLVSTSASLSPPYAVNDTIDGSLQTDTASQFRLKPKTTYYWEVLAKNDAGWGAPSAIQSFTTPAAASVGEPSSEQTASSVSPNPSAGQSHIHFTLPAEGDVSMNIFNTLGEQVQSLALGHLAAGSFDYALDLSGLLAGSYTYQLHDGDQIEMGRIVLLK